MKTQIVFSTCALIIGLSGAPSAIAESFNDEGLNLAMDSPSSMSITPMQSQALPPAGSFASSWGSGKTPTQYEGRISSETRSGIVARCTLEPPKIGFNQDNHFQTC